MNTLYGMVGLAHGVVNNPVDTDQWSPPPDTKPGLGEGMIQAAHHWSMMSKVLDAMGDEIIFRYRPVSQYIA
jgi:hypothetical protein